MKPFDIAAGLFLMWGLFGVFLLGFSIHRNTLQHDFKNIKNAGNLKVFPLSILSITSVAASLYSTNFYTGKGIEEVIFSLVSSLSLYNDYQTFFNDQSLGEFSLLKVPAIFSSFALKLILIYSTIFIFVSNLKKRNIDIFYYSLILASYLFFSLARGTSFELFEILVLVWYCIQIKYLINGVKPSIFSLNNIYLLIAGLASIILYNYNIQARYSFSENIDCPTTQLCMANDSLIMSISEPLAQLSNKLSGYFTFGILFSSVFIKDIWINSPTSFITYLLPASFIPANDIQFQICNVLLDCGVAWKPDVLRIIQNIGFFGLIAFIFTLGTFSRLLMKLILKKPDFIKIALFFFVFLLMISMPIGNFVTVSSSNILLLITIIIIFVINHIKFKFYNNQSE